MTAAAAAPATWGVVGLGLMGTALARRLLARGQRVLGVDVDAQKQALLVAAGGVAVSDLQALYAQATHVVLCVFDAKQVRAVVDALPDAARSAGAASPRVLFCTTTCDPAEMAEAGREVERRGHHFIEMPISGSSQQFAQGKAVGLVACAQAVHEAQRNHIAEICADYRYLGPSFGDASKTKLAVNLVLGINRAAIAEGLAFAQALGLDAQRFFAVLRESAAYSQVMDVKGPAMVERRFDPPQSRVDQSLKDFSLVVRLGSEAGIKLPFARRYRQMMADCIDHGEGHLDNAIIISAIERYAE